MIDLSSSSIEKKCYITNVSLDGDGTSYIVRYADGHQETHPFSVHNYNAVLHHMKEQFLSKKDRYIDQINEETTKLVRNELVTLTYVVASTIMFSGANTTDLEKLLGISLFLLLASGVTLYQRKKIREMRMKIGAVKKTEDFLNIMESFKIPVIDPNNGREEEWYMYNLSDVSSRSNVDLIRKIAESYTPELRMQEGERLSEIFKENYEKRLRKVPNLEK